MPSLLRGSLPLALGVLLALPSALGCGMTVHQLIAHRSLSYFFNDPLYGTKYVDLLLNNTGAMLAGAPYPDYLYQVCICKGPCRPCKYTGWGSNCSE